MGRCRSGTRGRRFPQSAAPPLTSTRSPRWRSGVGHDVVAFLTVVWRVDRARVAPPPPGADELRRDRHRLRPPAPKSARPDPGRPFGNLRTVAEDLALKHRRTLSDRLDRWRPRRAKDLSASRSRVGRQSCSALEAVQAAPPAGLQRQAERGGRHPRGLSRRPSRRRSWSGSPPSTAMASTQIVSRDRHAEFLTTWPSRPAPWSGSRSRSATFRRSEVGGLSASANGREQKGSTRCLKRNPVLTGQIHTGLAPRRPRLRGDGAPEHGPLARAGHQPIPLPSVGDLSRRLRLRRPHMALQMHGVLRRPGGSEPEQMLRNLPRPAAASSTLPSECC